MSVSQPGPTVASYRDSVTGLIEAGEPFSEVEEVIDQIAELTQEQKSALWLLAFSMREPHEQQRDARANVHSLG